MPPTPYDIKFRLCGFQTTIQPFFWIIAALFASSSLGSISNMQIWILHMLTLMLAILISILVHELGHALTFRYVFSVPTVIVVHGFGGATIPLRHHQRQYHFFGTVKESFLAFSGPLAGFLLAALLLGFLYCVPDGERPFIADLFLLLLRAAAWISIVWGIFNLLPVYPMDGGHISREIFSFFFPRSGVKYSLLLSMFLASLLAVLSFRFGQLFIVFLFGYFAYQNYQELSFRSFRR
jgi:Zn-dependent protease